MNVYDACECAYKNGYEKGHKDGYIKAIEDMKALLNTDKCVCCGAIIPEGRQICPNCEKGNE